MPAQFAEATDRLLRALARSAEDLAADEMDHRPASGGNSIGFDIWHAVRTVDNVVFFVFDRERPVWLAEAFDERFGLPRTAQGTGMPEEEAHALRFPEGAQLVEYIEAVRAAVVPRLAAMSMDYLAEPVLLKPWGELPRMEHVNQVILAHGNGHLGRVSLARALLGKFDLDI
ncbi:MAG: DinB family protein [Dehalococcoidia bacterium]